MSTDLHQSYSKAIIGVKCPCLMLDLNLFYRNIDSILRRSHNIPIRIATKSIRSLDVIKMILKSSTRFQGVMSYSASEATFLSKNQIDDILVAYPVINENEIKLLCQEIKKGRKIELTIDCLDHLKLLAKIAYIEQCKISVWLDLDMSYNFFGFIFGTKRSGVRKVDDSLRVLSDFIKASANLELVGILGYEAQIAGVPDSKIPFFKQLIIKTLKKLSIRDLSKRRSEIFHFLSPHHGMLKVNGGGTGSLESTILDESISEVAVGSGFYSPALFDHYDKFQHQPSLFYALEVTRHSFLHTFTAHGGGYIGSGQTDKMKQPVPYLPLGCTLLSLEGAGEVQTPFYYKGDNLKIGSNVFFRHAKAGELCEHFNFLHLINNGEIVGMAMTYRGLGQCF